jgi:Arc/MetJ-type ribon-helix-helix transcriptional regulator
MSAKERSVVKTDPALVARVRRHVAAGRYRTFSDFVREAIDAFTRNADYTKVLVVHLTTAVGTLPPALMMRVDAALAQSLGLAMLG